MTTTPTVPTVTTTPHRAVPDRHPIIIHRVDMKPELIATFDDHATAARVAAYIRGALADAYHAGRKDAEADNDREES